MTTSFGAATTDAPVCSTELKKFYDAYVALTTGQNEVRMRAADNRELQYGIGDIDKVLNMYNFWYAQCGADSGFPDLRGVQGQSSVTRGGPARIGC